MQETKAQTKNKGITLIALVVTIIVLLILAGVSIQMLAGQSGILKNAQQAREETVKGQIRDDVRREIMEKMTENLGDITQEELYKILNNYFEDVPKLGEEEGNPWKAEDFPKNFPELHSKEGNYSFRLGDLYSGTGNGNKWDETKVTPTEDGEGNIIPVPKDFHYIEGTKNTGVVIADNNGNEFVWVPVLDAKSESIVSTNTNTINFDSDPTPMAEKDGLNYRGLLYDEWDVSAKTVKYIQYNTSSCREPDILTGSGSSYDADSNNLQIIKDILDDETNYESADTFKTIMQKDYNDMINSVATYGGFYIARYEMSLTDWPEGEKTKKKAQFIKGATSATAEEESANKWYGLYAYNKQFATANGYSTVKSSMIWGSQWDAMMNWMSRCEKDVTKSIEGDINTERETGNKETDIINNIYDLYGNLLEFTLERSGVFDASNGRAYRGGFFHIDIPLSERIFVEKTDNRYA